MLFLLIVWIIIAIPCFLMGAAILSLMNTFVFERTGDRFVLSIWLGILVFAIIFQFISLFSPLLPIVGVVIFLSGCLVPLKLKVVRDELSELKSAISGRWLMIGAAPVLALALYASQPPDYFDTGLYHLQVIQWLAKYGAVPGAALIHDRFGFTSSWFALAASLHHSAFQLRSVAILGGFVIAMQSLHVVITVSRIIGKRSRFEDWFITIATLLIIPIPFGYLMAVSSSPDLPAMALIILIAWTMLVITAKEPKESASIVNFRLIPLILAGGAFALKLNTLPALIIAFLFYIFGGGKLLKRVAYGGVVTGLLATPQLISGIIASGCPGYPSPICFNLPWSVGIAAANRTYLSTLSYARWRNYFVDAATPEWLWTWLVNEQGVVLFLILSVISIAVILGSKSRYKFVGTTWIISLAALGITWILYNLPNPRFLISYAQLIPAFIAARYPSIFSPAVLISQLLPETDIKLRLGRFIALVGTILVYAAILRFRHKAWAMKVSFLFLIFSALLPIKAVLFSVGNNLTMRRIGVSSLLIPSAAPKLTDDEMIQHKVNDVEYVIPKTGRPYERQCWATDLPCTPRLTNEDIKLRDPAQGVKAGFVRNTFQ